MSKQYAIPRKTLWRHHNKLVRKPGKVLLGRFRPILDHQFESELLAHLLDMETRFFGLTTLEVRKLAFQLAEHNKIQHQFDKSSKMAGRKWLAGFLSRNPGLAIRKPEATSIQRAIGFNAPQVSRFFDLLKEQTAMIPSDQLQHRVYNMDESGLSVVHTPSKILAQKGKKQVGKLTSGEKGKTVTIICAMNACGTYVPPMIIFPRKRMNDKLMEGAPPGSMGRCSDNGWTTNELFIDWLKHFTDFTKASAQNQVILY